MHCKLKYDYYVKKFMHLLSQTGLDLHDFLNITKPNLGKGFRGIFRDVAIAVTFCTFQLEFAVKKKKRDNLVFLTFWIKISRISRPTILKTSFDSIGLFSVRYTHLQSHHTISIKKKWHISEIN